MAWPAPNLWNISGGFQSKANCSFGICEPLRVAAQGHLSIVPNMSRGPREGTGTPGLGHFKAWPKTEPFVPDVGPAPRLSRCQAAEK